MKRISPTLLAVLLLAAGPAARGYDADDIRAFTAAAKQGSAPAQTILASL